MPDARDTVIRFRRYAEAAVAVVEQHDAGAVEALRRLETLADELDGAGSAYTAALIRERIEGPSTADIGGQ